MLKKNKGSLVTALVRSALTASFSETAGIAGKFPMRVF